MNNRTAPFGQAGLHSTIGVQRLEHYLSGRGDMTADVTGQESTFGVAAESDAKNQNRALEGIASFAASIGNVLVADVARQAYQDAAVGAMLWQRLGRSLTANPNYQLVLCEDPESAGVSHQQLADVERAAFDNAGYGQRAEGENHFEHIFRGYEQHGPPRYVILVDVQKHLGREVVSALMFGDHFEIFDNFATLGQEYQAAAEGWLAKHPGAQPGQFIASKYVSDPRQPKIAVGLLGAAGLALASVLLGLASTNKDGVFVAARVQPNSHLLIRKILPRLVPGLEILLDRSIEGVGAGGEQAMMLAHIPPQSVSGR